MDALSIIGWIILGGISGWIASKFTGNDPGMGIGTNILVGIVGAFLGGWLVSAFGFRGVTGFNIWSFIVAIVGAVILLAIVNMISGRGARRRYDPNT